MSRHRAEEEVRRDPQGQHDEKGDEPGTKVGTATCEQM
jgi:hypothetical protein